ncbi:MAG: hypothetical protein JO236_06610 [Mycobacterium sp.]|uniref:hypothetical protein n=1 Tax=Mycobacterium sp. TaxID=1785 RepID=UPI001EC67714|nr:hypothetical protein [Mycobacterium sp.]MBW0017198.1 hypothetical protein [Mycobacterium sp.]
MRAVQMRGRSDDNIWLDRRTGWRDQATGCRICVCTPEAEPRLWAQYLDGALRSYRRHGVESVLDFDAIRDGGDTALFFAAHDSDGALVGGTRVVGPLESPEHSHALVEWDGNKGREAVRRMIANRLPFGVGEFKSAWVDSSGSSRGGLTRALARTALPAMTLLGVQFVMATSAAHVLEQWRSSGGVVAAAVPAAAYPNENYRTKLMWWDRRTLATNAEPQQFKLMCAEDAELSSRIAAATQLMLASTGAG